MNDHEPLSPLTAERIEALVVEIQAGQAESYRELVLHFQRRLQLYCYHMLGNRTESEDAVQEAFIKAYREIAGYRPTVSFSAWLYKIAYRHCLNVIRQRKGQQRLVSLIKLQWPSSPPPRAGEAANDILEGLSAEERQLIILRTLEQRSFSEIVEITGGNEAALRKRFERIRKKLNRKSDRKEAHDERQSLFSEG